MRHKLPDLEFHSQLAVVKKLGIVYQYTRITKEVSFKVSTGEGRDNVQNKFHCQSLHRINQNTLEFSNYRFSIHFTSSNYYQTIELVCILQFQLPLQSQVVLKRKERDPRRQYQPFPLPQAHPHLKSLSTRDMKFLGRHSTL